MPTDQAAAVGNTDMHEPHAQYMQLLTPARGVVTAALAEPMQAVNGHLEADADELCPDGYCQNFVIVCRHALTALWRPVQPQDTIQVLILLHNPLHVVMGLNKTGVEADTMVNIRSVIESLSEQPAFTGIENRTGLMDLCPAIGQTGTVNVSLGKYNELVRLQFAVICEINPAFIILCGKPVREAVNRFSGGNVPNEKPHTTPVYMLQIGTQTVAATHIDHPYLSAGQTQLYAALATAFTLLTTGQRWSGQLPDQYAIAYDTRAWQLHPQYLSRVQSIERSKGNRSPWVSIQVAATDCIFALAEGWLTGSSQVTQSTA